MRRCAATGALLLAGLFGLPIAAAPSATAAPTALDPHSVAITIEDVSPSTPTPSPADKPRSIAITLTLHNTTDVNLSHVSLRADRGTPIATEAELDLAIAKPSQPDATSVSPVRSDPLSSGTLVAGGTEGPLVYHTTTSTGTDTGICLCHPAAIYPLYFTVTATDPSTNTATNVGTAQTYLPAFGRTAPPAPLQVTWLWPLLDRPHRLTSTGYFLDDDLAGEVATGGRLDRALRVVEDVAADVQLTLVVDPDLLDELEVMSTDRYRVATPSPKLGAVPGTGAAVARAWLDRFTAVLDAHPGIDVDLTPYADPDVESLARNGLSWTQSLGDQDTQDRLADALGTRVPLHNVTWPIGHTLSQSTLTALVKQGRSTVVVSDTTLPRHRNDFGVNALAPLTTSAGPAIAAVTSGILERDVSAVLAPSGRGLNALPELIAHLALRVVASPDASHYVVLTPPRRIDVDPQVAERALRASTLAFWNQGMTLGTATRIVPGTDHGLLHPEASVPHLPDQAIAAMQTVDRTLPGLTGKYGLPDRSAPAAATSAAVTTIDRIPVGLQRTASSDLLTDPKLVISHAAGLARTVNGLRAAVHLVPPAGNASYTLTSNQAPLPVTIANPLDVTVQVRVQVRAAEDRPGFRTEAKLVKVPAGSTQQVGVPTRIGLTGRINVLVTLSTPKPPHGYAMSIGGDPLHLSVRNTALGPVGVAITTIAAIVLAIALLFRAIRALRWRMRRKTSGPAPPVTDPLAP